MIIKAYICFDEGGVVKRICLSKECDEDCSEYIVKIMTPIKRDIEDLKDKVNEFTSNIKEATHKTEQLTNTLKESINKMKRIRIK